MSPAGHETSDFMDSKAQRHESIQCFQGMLRSQAEANLQNIWFSLLALTNEVTDIWARRDLAQIRISCQVCPLWNPHLLTQSYTSSTEPQKERPAHCNLTPGKGHVHLAGPICEAEHIEIDLELRRHACAQDHLPQQLSDFCQVAYSFQVCFLTCQMEIIIVLTSYAFVSKS